MRVLSRPTKPEPRHWPIAGGTRMSCVKTSVLLALAIVSLLPVAAWADEEHTPDDASAVVQKYLDARIKKEGVFRFKDAQADAKLELVQDQIRNTPSFLTFASRYFCT